MIQVLSLQPWATVSGIVKWQDSPGAGEPIGLALDEAGGIIRGGPADTATDTEGKFRFGRVLPGVVVHAARYFRGDDKTRLEVPFGFACLGAFARTREGSEAHVQIGGEGRTVVGRLVGRDDWTGVSFSLAPPLPPESRSARRRIDQAAIRPVGQKRDRPDFLSP